MGKPVDGQPPILIIAPDESLAQDLATTAQLTGCPTIVARTLAEAFRSAREIPPSLVLLDTSLPGRHVSDACRLIRADPLLTDSALILYSPAPSPPELVVAWLEAGADDCVVTASLDELAARVVAHARMHGRLKRRVAVLEYTHAALVQSEDHYRRLFDHSNQAMVMWELVRHEDGQVVDLILRDANPQAVKGMGRSLSQLVGQRFTDLTGPGDAAEHISIAQQVAETGGARQYESQSSTSGRHYLMSAFMLGQGERGQDLYITSSIDITDHKLTEAALRRGEEQFHLLMSIIESSTEAIAVVSMDRQLIFANRAFTQLIGHSVAELNQYLDQEFQQSDLYRPLIEQWQSRLSRGESWQGEFEAPIPGGRSIDVWAHLDLARDAQGVPRYVLAILHDMAAERRAREALRLSEARYRGMVESQRDLVIRVSPDGRILYANAAYFAGSGTPVEELHGHPAMLLIHPEDLEAVRACVTRLLAGGDREYVEMRHETPSGLRWYGWELNGVPDNAGWVAEIQCVGRDITPLKEAQATLTANNARLRALLHAMPDMVFVMTKDGTYVDVVATDPDGLHRPPSQLLGRTWEEVLPADVAYSIRETAERAITTGKVQVVEYSVAVKGAERYREAHMVAVDADTLLAVSRDITDKKQAEARLRQALARERDLNQLKSRFVSMASHEFRTPLSAILSSVELLKLDDRTRQTEKSQRYLRYIHDSATHMMDLLQDLLLLGKIESGILDFSPARVNLAELCRTLMDEARLSDNGRHEVLLSLHAADADVFVDAKLFRHIVSNLVSNALKYSPEGATVSVDVDHRSGQAVIAVADQGIGIPLEDQPHVFETFFRADNVGNVPGTGLGLVIVQRSVQVHGGSLQFESKPGAGTTFVVTLPTQLED